MVKTEEIFIGMKICNIEKPHVKGVIQGLNILGQKNFFKVLLDSHQLVLVQKPEEWKKC